VNSKELKNLKKQLDELSLAQLVALAVQKGAFTFLVAKSQPRKALLEALVKVEGVLKPEQA